MKNQHKNPKGQHFGGHRAASWVVGSLMSGMLTPVAFANVVGSDMQNFNTTTSGLDFVTVESAQTLDPGSINFGLFMNEAVNSIPYFDSNGDTQTRSKFNDTIIGGDINIGYGVIHNLDIGLSLPQVVSSSVSTPGWNGQFSDTGNTDVRFNAKYKLVGDDKEGIAVQGLADVNRTSNNPYIGTTNNPIYTGMLIASKQVTNDVNLGVNLGYKARQPGDPIASAAPIKPLPSQYVWSAAANYRVSSIDSKIIAEVFGSNPVTPVDTYTNRSASSAEGLLGIKYDVDRSFALNAGAGTELVQGLSSPDWRFYAGMNYTFGPKARSTSQTSSQSISPVPALVSAKGAPTPVAAAIASPAKASTTVPLKNSTLKGQ